MLTSFELTFTGQYLNIVQYPEFVCKLWRKSQQQGIDFAAANPHA